MNFNELINPQAGVVMNPAMQAPQMDAYQMALGVNTPPPTQVPMSQMQAPVAPPAQVPAAPQVPQMPPEELQRRTAGWEGFLGEIQKPEVMGPLSTFVQTLMSPPRPGEHPVARVLRAQQLMQTHRQMLAENARKRPMELEKEQLGMRKLRAEAGNQESVSGFNATRAKVAAGTADVDIKRNKTDWMVQQENLREQSWKNALNEQFGIQDRKLGQDLKQKQIDEVGQAREDREQTRRDKQADKDAIRAEQQNALRDNWEVDIYAPWVAAAKARPEKYGQVGGFQKWLIDNPIEGALYKVYSGKATQLGVELEMRTPFSSGQTKPTAGGQKRGGRIDASGNYVKD